MPNPEPSTTTTQRERRRDDAAARAPRRAAQRRDHARRAAGREQRERERRQRVQAAGNADALPARQRLVEQPVGEEAPDAVLLEAERQHREHEHRDAEPDAQRPRVAAPAEPGDREQQDRQAREQRLLGDGVERVAHAATSRAPQTRLVSGAATNICSGPGVARDASPASAWPPDGRRAPAVYGRASASETAASSSPPISVRDDQPARDAGPPGPPPPDRRDRAEQRAAGSRAAGRG